MWTATVPSHRRRRALPAMLAVLLIAAPLVAHHSNMVFFDIGKTITTTGTVTHVYWTNPHIYAVIAVGQDFSYVNKAIGTPGTTPASSVLGVRQVTLPNGSKLTLWNVDGKP
jgi:hypothetical protein